MRKVFNYGRSGGKTAYRAALIYEAFLTAARARYRKTAIATHDSDIRNRVVRFQVAQDRGAPMPEGDPGAGDVSAMSYDITHTQFSDIYGKMLAVEPLSHGHSYRLFEIGDKYELRIDGDYRWCRVVRMAVVENTQHVNVEVIIEDENIIHPHV